MMKALVMYESMFGNTETVARAVADGMAGLFEVTVADVRTMPRASGMDVIVVGAPTHAFGLSRPSTRRNAVGGSARRRRRRRTAGMAGHLAATNRYRGGGVRHQDR